MASIIRTISADNNYGDGADMRQALQRPHATPINRGDIAMGPDA
jgi:hypothetical protein